MKIYYANIPARRIFGMVGRCGGGYNTVWSDWTPEGREAYLNITREFEAGINDICGHYSKLEEDILREGIKVPLVVTCGYPIRRNTFQLPPELRELPPEFLLLLEGITGGSRLWVAQKHDLTVPCVVNDNSRKFKEGIELTNFDKIQQLFPTKITQNPNGSVSEVYDPKKVPPHLGMAWSEDKVIKQRAPMWVKIMNKYGYYVSNLSAEVNKMLADAGVVQPDHLKKKFAEEG